MGDPRNTTAITVDELRRRVGTPACPPLFDVRREAAYREADRIIPTATWRDHRLAASWAETLTEGGEVVVYCVHGHQVSWAAVALLRAAGRRARILEGGIEAYREAGGPLIEKAALLALEEEGPSAWVGPARPGLEILAGAWLVRRFLDPRTAFHFVTPAWIEDVAQELGAGVLERPSAMIESLGLADPALSRLADLVEGEGQAEPRAPCLGDLARGLATVADDDRALTERGLVLLDALYAWCRSEAGPTWGAVS